MTKKFSKRWLTNLLIVGLGVVILITTFLASLQLWNVGADTYSIPEIGTGFSYPQQSYGTSAAVPAFNFNLNVNGSGINFLEVYDPDIIAGSFGDTDKEFPGFKLRYEVLESDGPPLSLPYAVVPLAPFNYLISNDPQYSYKAYLNNSGYLLLLAARSEFSGENSFRSDLINESIRSYERAVDLSVASFRIDGDILYTDHPQFLLLDSIEDPNVTNVNNFGPQQGERSVAISIRTGHTYVDPAEDSLAQQIFELSRDEANRITDTSSAQKIQAALNSYNSQIQSTTGDEALAISSLEQIAFGSTERVRFSVDPTKLNLPSGKQLARIMLNIDSTTVCNVDLTSSATIGTGCSWSSNAGTYTWDTNTVNNLGTNHPAQRTLKLKAFWAPAPVGTDNQAGLVNKAITVMPQGGNGTSENSSLGISISAPNSVNQTAENKITITANLDTIKQAGLAASPPINFKYITWWICLGTQETVNGSIEELRTCGTRKGHIKKSGSDDLSAATGTLAEEVNWNSSGSALGPHTVLVKAFGSGEPNEYIIGSKTVSNTINVTTLALPGGESGGGESGGGGAGGGAGTISAPNWAANFRASAVTTIDGLMTRVGSFTLLILGILAIIAIIIAGMKYITAGGDSKGAEVGKKALLYAIYGIILAVLCVMLVKTTVNEVVGIVNQRVDDPSAPGDILPGDYTGTNASISSIFDRTGIIWRFIMLAVYYAEAVAVFYILYASFLYITSFGEESKAESAKKTLIWAVIGLAFILSANMLLVLFADIIT